MPVSLQTGGVAVGQKNRDGKRPNFVPLQKLAENCQSLQSRFRARW